MESLKVKSLKKLSEAQENVINDIVDICNKYRKKNQDKDVRKSIKEIEFIEDAFTEVQKNIHKVTYIKKISIKISKAIDFIQERIKSRTIIYEDN